MIGSELFYSIVIPLDLASTVLFPIFIGVGLGMFFLPLTSSHGKMLAAKRLAQSSIREQLNQLTQGSTERNKDAQTTLERMERLMAIQMLRSDASAIPTWPFDTGVLGRFVAIILSVITILIARLATIALHL